MTKDNHNLAKFDINSGGAGGQVEQVAAVEAALLKDLFELGAEVTWSSFTTFSTQDNATTAMVAVGGPLTGTALSLLLDKISMMVATPCISRATRDLPATSKSPRS